MGLGRTEWPCVSSELMGGNESADGWMRRREGDGEVGEEEVMRDG